MAYLILQVQLLLNIKFVLLYLSVKKLIVLLFSVSVFISCGSNEWTKDEKSDFLKECVIGYKKSSPQVISGKVKHDYVFCWCKTMRDLTESKYPTYKEANNADLDDIYTLSLLANEAANIKCGEKPF